jgi:IS5 family transposase
LRTDLALKKVPDHSTLCYADQRLLKGGPTSPSFCGPLRPHRIAA